MSVPLKPKLLAKLKTCIDMCLANPAILHEPEFSFMKEFIEHFDGNVPKATNEKETTSHEKPKETMTSEKPKETMASEKVESESDSESEESDLELDMTGVVEPDTDVNQKMGNLTLQPTEEEIAESQAKRAEAVSAFVEKDYEKAIELYTEAILLNPHASLLYAKRGQVFLLMNKPNACIRDCNRALELNLDSAAAHKFRGRAYQMLGDFEAAANNLRLACKFDYDEQADQWLREVTPNARKIEEHKRKKERKVQEKLMRDQQEKLKKARENAKAYEENTRTSQTDSSDMYSFLFYKFMTDPDIRQALQDSEVAEAFDEISSNPANLLKYQNNPKIMAFINEVASKFGDRVPGGFPGTMGGMAGSPGFTKREPPKPNSQDDVGLD